MIGTDAYYIYKLVVTMTLGAAETIIDTAIRVGHAEGILPLTVVVADAGGNMVAMKREDGCGIMRADMAMGKAWGALGVGFSSREIRDRLSGRHAFQAALAAVSDGRFIPTPGGVLVLNAEEHVIGAVGISGDQSDKDEYCAILGIREAGCKSHPQEPNLDWREKGG